jgi:hypothetical protein
VPTLLCLPYCFFNPGQAAFPPRELVILAIWVLGAIVGIIALATGWITI